MLIWACVLVVRCRFASMVNNGELVMSSARMAWNALLPIVTQSAERQRVSDSVWTLLNCITATADKNKSKTKEVS